MRLKAWTMFTASSSGRRKDIIRAYYIDTYTIWQQSFFSKLWFFIYYMNSLLYTMYL